MDLTKQIEELLMLVEKPARYMGGELNAQYKNKEQIEIDFGFCFPDTYEIGMSYLGLQIIYHVLNEQDGVYCQRVFAPNVDMEDKMRERGLPLFTIEKKQPLTEMDVLGFTLQYELSFSNIVNMLDLAGIPIYSKDRDESWPIIAAGGNCSFNPEPLAEFIDFFMLGDGEDVLVEVCQVMKQWKKSGQSKNALLKELAELEGIYVPSFYEPVYDESGDFAGMNKLWENAPDQVRKRIVSEMDNTSFPVKPIVPLIDVVHDRSVIELFRGCTRGCRFCQAGMICRPVRERSRDQVIQLAEAQLDNTGYDEMSLLSLSTSDYSEIEPLVEALMVSCKEREAGLSLPSLRLDSFSFKVLQEIQEYRKSGLTFAPEAGTQRLRDVINKSITEEHIFGATEKAIRLGWTNIKLYFMIGLPTETDEDLQGIVDIGRRISEIARSIPERKGKFNVTVSVSNFVPKPHTPFQWVPQASPEEFNRKHMFLKERLRKIKGVSFQYHGTNTSYLEAVFARGDRRVGQALVKAWESGCRFDGWSEHFKYDKWLEAFSHCNIDPFYYTKGQQDLNKPLPWDIIDSGITKEFLRREYQKAMEEVQSPDCRKGCLGCGITRMAECPVYEQGENYE